MIRVLDIPSLGEGNDGEGTVIAIPFEVGDTVRVGDTLLEVETDKVTFEIQAEYEGAIEAFMLDVGEQIRPGLEFAKLSVADDIQTESKVDAEQSNDEYPKSDELLENIANVQETVTTESLSSNKLDILEKETPTPSVNSDHQKKTFIQANPCTRRLAREIGVDLFTVKGSGKRGRITKDDVKRHAKLQNQTSIGLAETPKNTNRPLPDLSEFGPQRREPLSNIAIATSNNMVHAWSRIPHAWLQQTVDITELEEWRQEKKTEVKKQGGSLTLTILLAKAVAAALKSFPKLNSSYDDQTNELVYKDYTDIGIAVDTEQGLVVPTLRQVDEKGMVALSKELTVLSEKARSRKLTAKDMMGAGITISNLGGIGLNSIFPIVNWPQVAIIGVAASENKPVYIEGEFVIRRILTVTLGFDHRVINGADGARFLVHLKSFLEDTRLMLL
jgi:pyruvate dehydrogenase E2 component (dihydrolipoamide acetyltransferase)